MQEPEVVASLQVSQTDGTILTDFEFDASASVSTQIPPPPLQFRWDWETDGIWDSDWSASPAASRRFGEDSGEIIQVTVEVSDGERSDAASVEISLDTRHGMIVATIPIHIENSTGLAHDGTHLWMADWGAPGTGRIYQIDPASGDTLRSIPAPRLWPGGLVAVGEMLWVSDFLGGPQLIELDPATGEIVSSFEVVYSAHSSGLAWDGERFYYGSAVGDSGGDGRIHVYSAEGTHITDFETPGGAVDPLGLSFDGVHLWATSELTGLLFALDPGDGTVLFTLEVPCVFGDLVIAGGYIWTFCFVGAEPELARIIP